MTPARNEDKTRGIFDVHTGRTRVSKRSFKEIVYGKNVLNLRPGFGKRHPWWSLVILLVLAGGIFWGIRKLSTRAEVSDFFPLTCLGSWQNPANAQGQPESLGTSSAAITADNAAVYDPTSPLTQIFCGAFVPPDYKTEGDVKNVGLTLVWNIPGLATTTDEGTATSTATGTVPAASATTTTTTTPTTTAPEATSTSWLFNTRLLNVAFADTTDTVSTVPTSSDTNTAPPTPPLPPSESTSTLAPATSSSEPGTTTAPTTTASAATIVETTTPTVAATSTATATTTEAGATTTPSSTVIMAPPITATLAPITSTVTSTATGTDVTVPPEASTTTSSAPVFAPPPPPDDNFLEVSYSVDGQTWVEFAKVGPDNWQNFTATLPVTSWDDLKKLQVKIEGIPTTLQQIPKVYLDGMFVEVHYEIPSVIEMTNTPTSTDEEASSTAPPVRVTLANPGARQTCRIEPFSQPLPPGGTTQFTAMLHPSISGVSYDLFTGYLPRGISVSIGSPSGAIAATSSLTFQAAADAQHGSFNIPVIYHEHEADGTVLSNFCQLNIDVR